jgi:hypothetical protein
MKRLILLVPLLCGACVGEQTAASFTLRAPARPIQVVSADHSAEHEGNLQRALDYSIGRQEAEDMAEWNAAEDQRKPVALVGPVDSCAIYNLDTETCDTR